MKALNYFLLVSCLICSSAIASDSGLNNRPVLQNPELKMYHGWLKYLDHRIEDATQRYGDSAPETLEWIHQRQEWTNRIVENPDVLQEVRGTQEWAYLSTADDSGQPFRFATPLDYDPNRSYGLLVYMHGYSGNHIEHAPDLESIPDQFRLSVLGRARGGRYHNLSENDVMETIRYMLDHWNIDPSRVHFSGGSMGGWATFYLSNRYPHLAASARPTCGYAANLPVGNWLHVPFYSTHSQDDPVVPVVQSRVPLKALQAMGGEVVIDETDGLGHAAWDYAEGNARGNAWYTDLRAPQWDEVFEIDYTAIDGNARQAYWAKIETWGKDHRPARMQLTLNPANQLYVNFHNIRTISIDVNESPVDPARDLEIILNGQPPVPVTAPLPDKLFLTQKAGGTLAVEENDPWSNDSGSIKHYPGGARNLYNGEPLLVIWGTGGNEEQNAAMEHAGIAAMRSAHPAWTLDDGQKGPDGIVHEHMTYSRLKGKADSEVTAADLENHHLVIIGSAGLNSVARQLSADLPISVQEKEVVTDDGITWACDNPLVFFTYPNPFDQSRLIHWISANGETFFHEGAPLTQILHAGLAVGAPMGGVDFALFEEDTFQLVATRTFDSDWHWSGGYKESPLIPASLTSKHDWYALQAAAYRESTGADAAIVNGFTILPDAHLKKEVTRFQDFEPFLFGQRLVVMELDLEQMQTLNRLLKNGGTRGLELQFFPENVAWQESMKPGQIFRVATTLDSWWLIAPAGKFAPASLHYTDTGTLEAYRTFLKRN